VELDDGSIEEISQGLIHLNSLKKLELDFSESKIGVSGAKSFSMALSKLTSLQDLDLAFTDCDYFDYQIVEILCMGIGNLSSLLTLRLNLFACDITHQGLIAISHMLKNMSSLQDICLTLTGISDIDDEGLEAIGSVLADHVSIQNINLSFFLF